MAKEADPAAQHRAVRAEVAAEHRAGPGANREESRQQLEQARLARAVRAEGGDDRALLDVEVHASERGKRSEQGHGRAEGDGGSHGAPTAYFDRRLAGFGAWCGCLRVN